MSPLRRFSLHTGLTIVLIAATASACASDDGRNLPEPGADQNQSILTTTTSTLAPGQEEIGDSISADTPTTVTAVATFSLALPWRPDAPIDARYTCQGVDERDISPAVQWAGMPAGTIELAVVITDSDAAGYVHWVVTGIDPSATGLPEASLPEGAVTELNSAGTAAYVGPCPPEGQPHSYLTEVIALGQQFEPSGETAADLVAALRGSALGITAQAGVYPGS